MPALKREVAQKVADVIRESLAPLSAPVDGPHLREGETEGFDEGTWVLSWEGIDIEWSTWLTEQQFDENGLLAGIPVYVEAVTTCMVALFPEEV